MASFAANLAETIILREAVKAGRGAIAVNGTADTMRFTHPASPNAITASLWFRIGTDLNYYSGIWSIEASSSTYLQFGLALNGTTLICNDLSNERTIQACSVGTWYFASFSIDSGGNVKMFVGTEGGTLTKYTTTLTNYTAPINEARIGGTSYGEYIDGRIADYRQWDAVLSDAEVHAEFYSEAPVRTSNLVGWYPLENTTAKLDDYNGSNDLTNPGGGSFAFGAGPVVPLAKQVYLDEQVYNLPAESVGEVYTPGSGGTAYTGDVNETVTVSEAVGAVMATAGALAETDTLSEATAAAYGAVIATPETVTLSESLAGGTALVGPVAETVTLSEATAAAYAAIVAAPETVTVSESLGTQSNEASGLAETVTLSESMTGGLASIGAVAETVTLSEASAALYAAIVAAPETVALSEALATGGDAVPLAETVTLAEALAGSYGAAVATTETVTLAVPAMPELASTDLHLVAEDWVPGSDWVSRVGGFTALLQGTLSKLSLGAIERNEVSGFGTSNYFRIPADSAHEATSSLQVTYEFLIRTTTVGGVLLGRYCSPYGGGFDIAQYSSGILWGIYNTAGTDFYRLSLGVLTLGNDYALVTLVLDSTNDTITGYFNGVADGGGSGHTSTLVNGAAADFFLGNSNGNDQPFAGGIIEVLRHREALTAAQVSSRFTMRKVAATFGTARAPAETVTVSESAASNFAAAPSIAETVTVTEATTLAQVLASGLAETVTLAESAAALASLARSVAETVSLAEALASSLVNSANIAETVTLTEAVALSQVLISLLTETVTLTEAMIGYIPRILVLELGNFAGVVTTTLVEEPVIAVETGNPGAVIAVTLTEVGMP